MPLSKEKIEQIRKDAGNWSIGWGNNDDVDSYKAGATTEAEKALCLIEALEDIRDRQPYPITVFQPITDLMFQTIAKAISDKFDISLDRFSGNIGRLLIKANQGIATAALQSYSKR